jgi:predicted transcriptional regulator YheO
MEKELKRQYSLLVDFLGHVLGPDYEIALHELKPDSNEIVALANGELTGRHLGSPLSNTMLEFVTTHLYESKDYVLQFESTSANGKRMRSNSMFIKGRNNELAGLLCINFDASRYEELSSRVMDLCGGVLQPAIPSGTHLIADRDDASEAAVQGYPTSIAGATASIVSAVVSNYPVEADRLTQDEKMEIMDILNRKGVFLLKGSVSYVAKELHSSEASIYRYLGKLNNK